QWDALTIREFVLAIIGAIFAGYIAVQNALIKKHAETIISQNISHEQNAQARAQNRPI
nr:hypothetical protein [Blastocatellia bacterium]